MHSQLARRFYIALLLFGLAVHTRAEPYLAAAGGVAWTHWLHPENVPVSINGHPAARSERIDRWEFAAGWRANPWLAFEGSLAGGGVAHNASFGGVTTAIGFRPPAPNPNSEFVTRSEYRRHLDVLAAGPVLSLALGRGFSVFTRQQLAAVSLTTHTLRRTYSGPVSIEPPVSQWAASTSSATVRSWQWQPAVGIEWRPLRSTRWRLGLIATNLESTDERATACLARSALSF